MSACGVRGAGGGGRMVQLVGYTFGPAVGTVDSRVTSGLQESGVGESEVRSVGERPMKSPFPGMDPYLEPHWGDVHSRLATIGSAALNRNLPVGIRARVHESIGVEVDDPWDDEVVTYYPDVAVVTAGK